jgi:hypothetical protein
MVEIQGAAIGGGNQHVEEVDQVEDITAITAPLISATKEVVPIAIQFPPRLGEKP